MSACDITGSSPTAFDHKQIIRYFYFTLKTCLIKTCLILVAGVNNISNVSQGNNCTFNVSQCNNCQLSHTSNILVVITLL